MSKETINQKQFAALCYLVLMSHHGHGYINAHPGYIESKLAMLEDGYNAYLRLDRKNQQAVKKYFKKWNIELPEKIQKYETNMHTLDTEHSSFFCLTCGELLNEKEFEGDQGQCDECIKAEGKKVDSTSSNQKENHEPTSN